MKHNDHVSMAILNQQQLHLQSNEVVIFTVLSQHLTPDLAADQWPCQVQVSDPVHKAVPHQDADLARSLAAQAVLQDMLNLVVREIHLAQHHI